MYRPLQSAVLNSTLHGVWFSSFLLIGILVSQSVAQDAEPSFSFGINLNGPPVFIDGNRWDGSDSPRYACEDKAFESQQVPLVPTTDPERAKMIRSSRWGGNRVELKSLDPGLYTLFLYVWEDNNSEVYSIQLNDRPVVQNYQSGTAGNWAKLGPWPIHLAKQGDVVITSQGGAANFSGIEVWRGNYDGLGRQLTEDEIAFFEKRIRPVLVEKCYECHSAESKELQGDLLVDSRASIRNGGTKGACVIPGDVEKSLLIQAIRYEDEEMQMPPDGKLSDAEIADLTEWIRMGAPDPRSTATKHLGKQIDVAEARQFWSLKPLSTPTIPNANNRIGSEIRSMHSSFPRWKSSSWLPAKMPTNGPFSAVSLMT